MNKNKETKFKIKQLDLFLTDKLANKNERVMIDIFAVIKTVHK